MADNPKKPESWTAEREAARLKFAQQSVATQRAAMEKEYTPSPLPHVNKRPAGDANTRGRAPELPGHRVDDPSKTKGHGR